jgi:hypothetical protein
MGRKEEFPPNGQRIRVTPQEVADAWRLRSPIDPRYIIATADHESSFTVNEIDTEPNGFVSIGIFQLSQDEAVSAGLPNADLMTLEGSCDVMAKTAARRLANIMSAANLTAPTTDCWFYLALCHNQGWGACHKTICAHGLDAAAWTARNPQLAQAARYFSDCVTGGARWAEVALH